MKMFYFSQSEIYELDGRRKRRLDTVTGEPKVSLVWMLAAMVAAWVAIGGIAYLVGKLLRAVLT